MSDQKRLNETVAKRAINAMVDFAHSVRKANTPPSFGEHTESGITVYTDPYEWVNTPQGYNELASYCGRLLHGFEDEMSADEKLQAIAGPSGVAGQMAALINGIVPDLRAEGERLNLARLTAEVCNEVKAWTTTGYDLIYPSQKTRPGSPIVLSEALDRWERISYPIHEKLWTIARQAARKLEPPLHAANDNRLNTRKPTTAMMANVGPSVILQGRNRPVLVNGTPKRLTAAQYDVIELLVNARPNGLTKDSLERNAKHTDARGILTRLRHDPDWEQVIYMAGMPGGRYRIG